MSKNVEVEYGTESVELSRVYPFGETVEVKDGSKTKDVTKVTLTELNGFDDETIAKQVDKGKNGGYVQISISAGIEYNDALRLAGKDAKKIIEVLEGF